MKRISTILAVGLVTVLCVLAGGCAHVGGDFAYEGPQTLKLGQTRPADARALFGEPMSSSMTSTSNGSFEQMRYLYAYATMRSAQSRLLDLEFRNGVLNGYSYLSSFDDDKTQVHAEGFAQIKRGESKKADALRILGEPQGKALSPSEHVDFKPHLAGGVELWIWTAMGSVNTFASAYGGQQASSTTIYLTFNADGVVTDIQTVAQNN
jgi:hypothetical protein